MAQAQQVGSTNPGCEKIVDATTLIWPHFLTPPKLHAMLAGMVSPVSCALQHVFPRAWPFGNNEAGKFPKSNSRRGVILRPAYGRWFALLPAAVGAKFGQASADGGRER